MRLTGPDSAHSKLSSGLVAQKNHHTVHRPPVLLSSHSFPSRPFHVFSHISACPVPSCQAAPVGRGGCVGLAWEEMLGGPRELVLGGCKGRAAEAPWPCNSIGNAFMIVDVSVKQAQTQEAKCVHRGMCRDGVCNCTSLIFLLCWEKRYKHYS